MSFRTKNAVIISLVVLVALAVIAGVVVTAVEGNRHEENGELFIDEAPIDYGAAENVIYVGRFRDAIEGYFANFSQLLAAYFDFSDDGTAAEQFTERLLYALSESRVPAYKLSGMATALKGIDIQGALSDVDLGKIDELTEEDIMKLFSHTSFEVVGAFLDSFFEESLLTGEEFGNFLYVYIDTYGSSEQKSALEEMGKDKFVGFVGTIGYAVTALHGNSNGATNLDGRNFSEAFFQMGSVLLAATEDPELFEKVMGLNFNFVNNENQAEMSPPYEKIKGKIGGICTYLGFFMREIDSEIVSAYSGETDIDKIMFCDSLADAAERAGEKFMSECDVPNIGEYIKEYCENSIILYNKADDSADFAEETTESVKKVTDDFYSAVGFFRQADPTYETLAAADEETLKTYLEKADAFYSFYRMADLEFYITIYLWGAKRIDEGKGGDT